MEKINYTKWGLAYVLKGQIYLHEGLKNHPQLQEKILKHELRHLRGEKYVDFREPFDFDILLYRLEHPSTLADLLPVWIQGRQVSYDLTMALIWLMVGMLVGIISCMIKWYST
jgi:hypothetical protein